MAPLRRGIAHYAEGDPDTTSSVRQPYLVPGSGGPPDMATAIARGLGALTTQMQASPTANLPPERGLLGELPSTIRDYLYAHGPAGRAGIPRPAAPAAPAASDVTPAAPDVTPAAPDGRSAFSQLSHGQFTEAQQNPAGSPATHALARFADFLDKSHRVGNLGTAPSPHEKLMNVFAGDDRSTADIAQREGLAREYQNPALRQHLFNNPDELTMAERDPAGYLGTFKTLMGKAQQVQAAVQSDPNAHRDDHHKIIDGVLRTGESPSQVNAAVAPHRLTADEFVNATRGLTWQGLEMLYGPRIRANADPKNVMAQTFFKTSTKEYEDVNNQLSDMFAKTTPAQRASGWWSGKSEYDKLVERRDALRKALMSSIGEYIGAAAKMPGVQ